MTNLELKQITKNREKRTLEFKEAWNALPSNIFETVCAFLNRDGGVIVLGAHDDGTISSGVNSACVEQLSKNLANMSNNSEVLSPTFLLQPEIVEIDEDMTLFADKKYAIVVQVPSSSQVHNTKGKIFDRSVDGDYELRTDTEKRALYLRKSTIYTESTIYPHLKKEHFKDGIVEKAKNLIRNLRSDHPWLELSEMDFFKQANLYRTDIQTGEEGFTLAALMLFGKDEIIQSALPYYKIDCVARRNQTDRYDDRFTSFGNIIDGYTELMQFVEKHFPDTFYLEGDQRVSLRDKVFREVIVNLLIHREYQNPSISIIDIRKHYVLIQNANRPLRSGIITLDNYEPHPKNPHIANFFVQMGRAEHLGTGVRNLYRYAPLYFGENPKIEDDNMFSVRFAISSQKQRELIIGSIDDKGKESSKEKGKESSKEKGKEKGKESSKEKGKESSKEKGKESGKEKSNERTSQRIVAELKKNPYVTMAELQLLCSLSKSGVEKQIRILKKEKCIRRKGGRRYGKWEVLIL